MEIQSLNIYGCEFAKGKVGEDAVSYLESTLGLTVAASTNLSGNDGDWILEIGQPRAAIAVSEYKGNLQWTLADICTTCDFDGDGIPNNLDLDNDNDGIKDDIESPSCFYNLDVLMYGDRTSLITVTTPLSLAAGYSITDAVDALPTNGATTDMVKFNSATLTNQEFLRFQFPYAVPLNHISLLWYRGAPAIDFTTGTTYSIQGSNDPSSGWTTITSSATITNNNRTTEMDFTNTTSYLYYRIFVTSGTLNTNELEDIMFGFSEKVMELPIAGCSADLDGDGFPNHMDTDADGDGCPDAKEGSNSFNTSSLGAVATNSSLATYGIPTIAGYGQGIGTSQDNTQVSSSCSCTDPTKVAENCDYDGDGVVNGIDLDDDNDGILDIVEGLVYSGTSNFTSIGYDVVDAPLTACTYVTNMTDYYDRNDLYGLPWFPGSDVVSTYPNPNNPTIDYPTTSHWVGILNAQADHHIQDIYADFSCHTNLQFRITGDYCQKTWLYISTDGTPYTASLAASITSGTSATTATYNPTGTVFLRVYQYDDAQGNEYYIEFKSDQQTDWVTLDSTNPACRNTLVGSTDTDQDGIPNYLDLDSDNDGCLDAIEGGATFYSNQLVGAGGLAIVGPGSTASNLNLCGGTTCVDANGVPTIAGVSGQSAGTSQNSTILDPNCPCNDILLMGPTCDYDGDGISNSVDIDDDNDGVLDAVESPNCYYTPAEANNIIGVTTGLNVSTGSTALLYNDISVSASPNFTFDAGQQLAGANIFTVEYTTPIKLTSLTIVNGASLGTGSTGSLFGSNDGVTWTDLMTTTTSLATTASKVLTVNQNAGEYRYYRVQGEANSTTTSGAVYEITSIANTTNYIPSAHPKASCVGTDTDGDNIPNNFDLDSDNDGCPDSFESGTTASNTSIASEPFSANGFADGLETSIESGVYNDTYTYDKALNNTINNCTVPCSDPTKMAANCDFDGDGIVNSVDIDDDNDGIPDAIESCVSGNQVTFRNVRDVSSNGGWTTLQADMVVGGVVVGTVTWQSNLDWTTNDAGRGITYDGKYLFYSTSTGTTDADGTSTVTGFDGALLTITPLPGYTFSGTINFVENANLSTLNQGENGYTSGGIDNSGTFTHEFSTNADGTDINATFVEYGPNTTYVGNYNTGDDFNNTTPIIDQQNALPQGTSGGSTSAWGALIPFNSTSTSPFTFNYYAPTNAVAWETSSISFDNLNVTCASNDLDGDGISNEFDIDSDGDGCPDAVEASVAGTLESGTVVNTGETTTLSGAIAQGPYGENGLANSLESNDGNNPSITYNSTYNLYAINSSVNLCSDFDNDGVPDFVDLDDDNDGILDAVESPTCFYTQAEAQKIVSITSDMTTNTYSPAATNAPGTNLSLLYDGNTSNYYTRITANSLLLNGMSVYTVKYSTPIQISSLTLVKGAMLTYNVNSYVLQGSNDNMNWTTISSPTNDVNGNLTLTNTSTTKYQYYRVLDNGYVSGTTGNISQTASYPTRYTSEISITYPTTSYVASAYPKPSCTGSDADGDGIPNHLDLDADGDGCSDAYEAGVTTQSGVTMLSGTAINGSPNTSTTISNAVVAGPYDANGFANSVETTLESGVYESTYTYSKAINSSIISCPVCTDPLKLDANCDFDGDGITNENDLDDDNDGITDVNEGTDDTDGDGLPDKFDLDSDNDGITDVIESGGSDPDNNGIIGTGLVPGDSDGDGLADVVDIDGSNTGTPNIDTDGDGIPNTQDLDADNDGLTDVVESGGTDANNDGIVDGTDPDHDGILSSADQDPTGYGDTGNTLNPTNTDGNGNPNYLDIDADDDGIVDNVEWQTTAGYIPPTGLDSDGDGIDNAYDQTNGFGDAGNTNTPTNTDGTDTPDYIDLNSDNTEQPDNIEAWDTNNNGIIDGSEPISGTTTDSDGDGLLDVYDNMNPSTNIPTDGQTPTGFPNLDGNTTERDWRESIDTDGDGIPNEVDLDDDNDGITDVIEGTDDTDGDGIPDSQDLDSDNDGITDVTESGGSDPDNNGIIGTGLVPGDSDGDGLADVVDIDGSNTGTPNIDTDGDGIPNTQDLDADNDGLTDVVESGGTDANNDGIVDGTDPDHDGILSSADQDPTGYGDTGNTLNPTNTDGNGNPNYLDIDADDDGIVDNVEWQTTAGYIPPTGLDSDGDGIDNAYDQTNGFGDAGNTNIPTNTDGTDTPDYIDLDSDNTEQPDNIEAWDTNNDGIINLGENVTGVSSTLDSDGDGLLDIYDNLVTTPKEGSGSIDITDGETATSFPNLDTPSTPERDWRETMTPLPLELISFNGHKVNGGNQLNWVTKDEKDIDKFRLYRSFDGINYHLLTSENSKSQHNNVGQELTYQFLDTRPNVGVNYYKLSAVEFNLSEEFFNVIILDNSIKGKKYTVRPTIVRTNVIVDINSFNQVRLSLYSLDGKLLNTTSLQADGSGNIQGVFNMSNLPSGLYLINGIDTVSGQRFTEKVIKE